jgi:RHS repeat-associated protein
MRLDKPAVHRLRFSPCNFGCYLTGILLVGSCMSVSCQVQTGQPASGANSTPIPGSGHDYLQLLSETVDPASGSVNLNINYGPPQGRGIVLPATYNYASSNVFSITQDAITQVIQFEQPRLIGQNDFSASGSFPVATWSESTYQIPPTIEGTGGTEITYPYCNYANSFTFKDASGASHNLNLSVTATAFNGPQGTGNACGNGATATATDGQVTAAFTSTSTTTSQVGSWVPSNQTDPAVNGAVGAFTVTDAAGTTYFFGGNAESITSEHVWEESVDKIEDRNGNVIALGSCPTAVSYCDTLLRPVVSSSGSSITVAGVTYTQSNGSAGMATINYSVPETGGSVNSGGNTVACPTTSWTVSATGISSVAREQIIGLPNGTNYTLYFGDYNPTDSTVTNPYGLINEIIYPDGGWVKYTWVMSPEYAQLGSFAGKYLQGPLTGQPYPSGCVYEYSTPVVSARQVSYDGVHVAQQQAYTYTTTWSSSDDWTNKTTKVVTTDESTGKSTQTLYSYLPGGYDVPLEQTVSRYDWGNTSTPLDTETKAWYSNGINQAQLACDFHTTNTGKSTGHFYQYAYAQISDDKQYDYGQIGTPASVCTGNNPSAPTSPIPARETATNFQAFTNALGTTFGKPSSVTIYGNGTQIRQTAYSYDQTAVSSASATSHDETHFGPSVQSQRGNNTSITTGASTTSSTYDETGQVTSVIEPCGNTSCSDMSSGSQKTTYSYGDSPSGGNSGGNSNAYLTSITYPQVNGVTAQKTFTYSYPTGELATATDENSHTTSYTYADSLKRLTEVLGPSDPKNGNSQAETTYCYQDSASSGCANDSLASPNVVTAEYLSSSNPRTSISAKDGMGHVVETAVTSDVSGADIVNIAYNGEGQIASQSNPHRLSAPSSSDGTTLYTYDALNRKTIQTQPDKSFLQWCYNGIASNGQSNCAANASSKSNAVWIDYADETGRDDQQVGDGLGRLAAALEPNPAGGSRLETDYQYDALNDLTQVDQWGGPANSTGDRQRKFSYDSLSRLLVATNPETGKIGYTYDANSNVASKTDARGAGVWYCYDNLNRLTGKAYASQSCTSGITSPIATYAYDSSSVSGATNDVGHMTSATAYNGSTVVAKTVPFAYSVMGQLLTEQECTPVNCAGTPYSLGYSYDLAGDLTSASNGASNDGIVAQYSYDSVQRLNQIVAVTTWTDNNHPSTLLNQTNYGPVGLLSENLAIDSTTLQPAISMTRTYDSRLRTNTESDTGNNIVFPAGGAGSLTISGAVESKGSTTATGSVTIAGSEQNKQTAAATGSTGSIIISGNEQQVTSAGSSGAASVSIYGSEETSTFEVPCGSQQCPVTAYDSGSITVVISGVSYSASWGAPSTPSSIAVQLAASISGGSLASATANGNQVIITAIAKGTASDYTLGVYSTDQASPYFSSPSFTISAFGSTLTGGAAGITTYDSGNISASIDGCVGSYSYGQSSTSSSLAIGVAAALSSSCNSILSATASGSTVALSSKSTGTTTNWPITAGVSYNTGTFSSASFAAAPAGLTGAKNAVTVYDSGTVALTVNGYGKSVSFGQNDTTSTIAANLTSAINADGSELVTASASAGKVNLTTKLTGTIENVSIAVSDTYSSSNFSSSSFTGTSSGSTLTGGTGTAATTFYDAGTVNLTINGTEETVNYAQGDTASSVASKFVTAFAGDTAVAVNSSGATLAVASKTTGSSTDYAYAVTSTYDSKDFSSPSFASKSGSLTGGTNGSSSATTVYSYSIPAYTGSTPAGYDANGNIVGLMDSVMGSWKYQYDSLNRVTGGANSGGGPNPGYSDCFAYDNWGNRTLEAYTATACGSSPAPTTAATYNTNNQITATGKMVNGYIYDAAGNVLNDGMNSYAYDNEERICAVQSVFTGTITGYIYDATGSRVAKVTQNSLSCALTAGAYSLTASYALGPNGEEFSEFNSTNVWQYSNVYADGKLFATYLNSPSEIDFTLYDWLGTKRVTVHPNGSVATCSSSLAFGNNLTPCGGTSSDPSNLHFTGKERDNESGNDYFGARYYSSEMGRWMSPDWSAKEEPVPYAKLGDPQSLNLYSYVLNNPLGGVDADGHGCSDPAICQRILDDLTVNHRDAGEAINAAQQQNVPPPPPPPAPAPVFRNPNEAAMNAAAGITGAMQATGNEWGAAVYKTSNGMIGVTPLRTDGLPDAVGTSGSYTGKDIPAGATRIGDIHGHPDGSRMSGDTGDRGVAFMELKAHGTETQYMVNMKGEVWKFNPATDRVPSLLPGRIQ